MERRIAYLPAIGATLIAGAAGFYLGMSQCGGQAHPRGVAFALAVLSTLAIGATTLYKTRSKSRLALTVGCGILGYYVGGSLGWIYYIGPATASETLSTLFEGLAGGCYR